ncbi:phosphatidylinositol glycan anchor biosynthesis class U protein [Episyrphus balteatus]|uniref:phosphatidylinositol glycan anchor biosynthesis class U protein n=1 Tax=Episyrphus balteatus TaxID=286459 RepID=UPI00248698BA|nr:phosphatidylinositol glycan anchor biosynthesis class U protein [Episyrphus balteatus]
MKNKKALGLLILGGTIRYILMTSKYSSSISGRVEISTPLNSYKRVQEGVYLYKNQIDPYQGDMVHETPLVLLSLAWASSTIPLLVPWIYIMIDLAAAFILYKMSTEFINQMFAKQSREKGQYADETDELHLKLQDTIDIPKFVFIAYLMNPLTILNCVGLSSTVFSNFFLALCFFFMAKHKLWPCLAILALETMRNLYPVVFIAPIMLVFGKSCTKEYVKVAARFLFLCFGFCYISYAIMGSWTFLNGTLGFVFFCRELQPNIGLFWYFFMEMFDHFRTLFLITFQINATILYLIPLTFKLHKDPLMLTTILISLTSIFRSYPCLGDIAFYLAFLPLWRRCWKFMAHNFVVFCFFLITLLIMPALWYLWMYAGSANANFYFGATLAFSTGQIFLVTDLLFAYVKREFCLKYGQKVFIDGKEAKIILE